MVPILALVLAQTQPSITFSIGASRVPVILEKLSSQTGIEFRSGPQLQDEVLFISVKNAPLNELMSEIAHVTHCTWERNPKNGFDLIRTQGQELADEAAETALTLSMLKKALQSDPSRRPVPVWSADVTQANLQRLHDISSRLVSKLGSSESRQADYAALSDLNITQRGVDRLFGSIDPVVFADQRTWEYRRYTQNPNQFQFGLSDSTAVAIDGFRTEEQVALSNLDGVDDRDKFRIAQGFGINGGYRQPLQGPVVALIKSRLMPFCFQWEISFCDRAGIAIETGSKSLSLPTESDLSALTGFGNWGNAKFRFPSAIAEGRRPSKVGAKAEDLLLVESPLEHDPLGLVCEAGLTRLGAETHEDIVAALPDECIGQMPQSETLANFCMRLASCVTFKNESGRLLIAPTRRAEAYAVRAKRAPLEALLRAVTDEPLPLDLGAKYAGSQNELACFSPLESAVFAWNHHWAGIDRVVTDLCGNEWGQRLKLKFYGSLSEVQKQRMANGGVQFRELDSDEQGVMTRWLFGTRTGLQRSSPGQGVFGEDPTFSLSRGIPASALVTLKGRKTFGVIDTTTMRTWDCNSIGYIAAQQEKGEFLDSQLGYPMISQMRVKPATTRQFNFNVEYEPRLTESFQFEDTSADGSETVKVRDLPASWLVEVDKTLDYYRKMFKNVPSQGAPPQRSGPPL